MAQMDLYTFADNLSASLGLSVTQGVKEQIISSLRTAGYTSINSDQDEKIATKIFINHARKLMAKNKKRTAALKDATKANPKDRFNELRDLNAKGLCGKCKKPMTTAKLRDGEEVNFCQSCRVTLWK